MLLSKSRTTFWDLTDIGSGRIVGYSYLGITPELPVVRPANLPPIPIVEGEVTSSDVSWHRSVTNAGREPTATRHLARSPENQTPQETLRMLQSSAPCPVVGRWIRSSEQPDGSAGLLGGE